jgi:hypothetical protein
MPSSPVKDITARPLTRVSFPVVAMPADLIRLVTDPTVSQIQLVGDIVLTHDLFPPEESYDQTKGVTISSKVSCRANNSVGTVAGVAQAGCTSLSQD